MLLKKFLSWLPQLRREIWILTYGSSISQIGHGLLIFSASIFWVNLVGLSPTQLGIGLGSASLAGVVGRFLGGSLADSPFFSRRRTLLLAILIPAIADVVLVLTHTFSIFIVGSILTGLGTGMSWPAITSILADLTTTEQRNEAFALIRLAERLGLNFGVLLGGLAIAIAGAKAEIYRALFLLDGFSFLLFFALIYFALSDTHAFEKHPLYRGWAMALSDRRLMLFAVVEILVVTTIAQIQSTLPLYFRNFVRVAESARGFSPLTIGSLFTWYTSLTILSQLPLARFLNRFSRLHALMLSLLLFGGGFILVWLVGSVHSLALIAAVLALGFLALALAAFDPLASAFVADLAPPSLRGIYLSINSLCWAIGYGIGPLLGGWALDRSPAIARDFWLLAAASIGLSFFILLHLNRAFGTP